MNPHDPEFCVPLKTVKASYRPRFDRRSFGLLLFLLAGWLGLTWGTDLFWMTIGGLGLMFSSVLVIGLAMVPVASGLIMGGLGGRFIASRRRKSQWESDLEA